MRWRACGRARRRLRPGGHRADDLTWPAATGDAVANKEVLGGWNPARMQFAQDRWARLAL